MKKLPIQFKLIIVIVIFACVWSLISGIFSANIELYNTAKKLELSYDKEVQTQISNYDGYYLAFADKQENAKINKEVFIEVTQIIMNNRKDGENLAWKWLQENQNIPYQEFTVFYKELSSFISERYADNMAVEQRKQSIAQQHNTLLVTFPNTFYNSFLKIAPIEYKFGYISDNTKQKFK